MEESYDQQIITTVLTGNVDAYRHLVLRYEKPIFNLMYRMTGSREDALDLAQETFIKAYEKLEHFKTGSRFFPWLYTIGLNNGRNFIRDHKMEKQCLVEMGGDESWMDRLSQQNQRVWTPLDVQRLREGLQQLPLDYREAMILHYHEGFSMKEIADALELSVSGAKMRVHRGLRKLRQIMDGGNHETEAGGTDERARDRVTG
jgi:RNA polymerase sigma-70 factor (ECF subfamily)